jgi:site-specific DNA-methyltransferase (adenine-specific)
MGRTLTPERQKQKREALSLRYDYGWTERRIAVQLNLKQTSIHRWVNHNTHNTLNHNPTNIRLLEGDCLELLKDIPDNSVDCLLTDPPYSVMEDYDWDKKTDDFYHQWLTIVKPKMKDKHTGFIFFDSRRLYEFEGILRNYFPIKNKIVWIRKNMALGRIIKGSLISSYEVIFYFGNRPLDLPRDWGEERFDSCEFAVPQTNFTDKKVHPTQKPFNLILQLIKIGSHPSDVILDCFAGSGVTAQACRFIGNHRKCILMENDPNYARLIKDRFRL